MANVRKKRALQKAVHVGFIATVITGCLLSQAANSAPIAQEEALLDAAVKSALAIAHDNNDNERAWEESGDHSPGTSEASLSPDQLNALLQSQMGMMGGAMGMGYTPPPDLVTEAKVTSVQNAARLNRQGECLQEQVIALGRSMTPYLFNGEALAGTFGNCVSLDRGSMVIYDNGRDQFAIKWLLGLPGDEVGLAENGQITINGEKLFSIEEEPYILGGRRSQGIRRVLGQIPDDHYLVLGNLKATTLDSSVHGYVRGDAIRGTAKKITSMKNPVAWVDMEAVMDLVPSHVSENEVYRWLGSFASEQGFTQVVDKKVDGVFPAIDITSKLIEALENTLKPMLKSS
jgi:signal peptidase I